MTHTVTGWIDIPVIQAIEYFSGVLSTFYKWGSHYALAIGTIGLCWAAFKLINSRFSVRDFWWDTFYKWLLFILFMSISPLVTMGISAVGNRVGIQAGKGKQAIIDSLTSMKQSIEQDLAVQEKWADELEVELNSNFENFTFETSFGNSENYNSYIDSLTAEIGAAKFNSKIERKTNSTVFSEQEPYRQSKTFLLKNGLTEQTEMYLQALILTSTSGSKTQTEVIPTISPPSAILRVSILGCQIMWEKNQIAYALDLDEIDEENINFMKKGFNKMTATIAHVPTMIMTMLCCIVLIACCIFALIQYVMTILEYTIVMGIGAFFIPFILFDGTKDLPKKLVPVFTGFFIKMIVMTICLFFVFYLFIQETVDIMAENGGMNWVSFSTICFTSLIALVLTQNAPKIAMTLLTGQPQLSMGEFVQAVGSAVVGGKLLAKEASATAHATKEGARNIAQGYVDTRGGFSKVRAAGKAASQSTKELGGTDSQARSAAVKGMFATVGGDLKDKFKNAGNNFLHGGNGGKRGMASSGGGMSGNQAHQRSGQNTSRELGKDDSRTLNQTSNPHFQNATKFDSATQSSVNMTRKEFYDEKRQQGANIGNSTALKVMEKAEKKQQQQKKDFALPENLTGNEREYEGK